MHIILEDHRGAFSVYGGTLVTDSQRVAQLKANGVFLLEIPTGKEEAAKKAADDVARARSVKGALAEGDVVSALLTEGVIDPGTVGTDGQALRSVEGGTTEWVDTFNGAETGPLATAGGIHNSLSHGIYATRVIPAKTTQALVSMTHHCTRAVPGREIAFGIYSEFGERLDCTTVVEPVLGDREVPLIGQNVILEAGTSYYFTLSSDGSFGSAMLVSASPGFTDTDVISFSGSQVFNLDPTGCPESIAIFMSNNDRHRFWLRANV